MEDFWKISPKLYDSPASHTRTVSKDLDGNSESLHNIRHICQQACQLWRVSAVNLLELVILYQYL